MEIQPLEILKWIGIVLAAGFVGYIGRYIAMLIIGKLRGKEGPGEVPQGTETPAGESARLEKSPLKLEKKKAKQAAKEAKKAPKN